MVTEPVGAGDIAPGVIEETVESGEVEESVSEDAASDPAEQSEPTKQENTLEEDEEDGGGKPDGGILKRFVLTHAPRMKSVARDDTQEGPFIIDPELENALPAPDKEVLDEMERSIKEIGVTLPLVLWQRPTGKPILADGHWRYKFAKKHNKDFATVNCPDYVQTKKQALMWIYITQSGRRNLTKFQTKWLSGKLLCEIKKNPTDNLRRGTANAPSGDNCQSRELNAGAGDSQEDSPVGKICPAGEPHSADVVGKLFHISPRTVRDNANFYRRVEEVAKHYGSDSRNDILSGKMTLVEYEGLKKKEADDEKKAEEKRRKKHKEMLGKMANPSKNVNQKKYDPKNPGYILASELFGFSEHMAGRLKEISIDEPYKKQVLKGLSAIRRILIVIEGRINSINTPEGMNSADGEGPDGIEDYDDEVNEASDDAITEADLMEYT